MHSFCKIDLHRMYEIPYTIWINVTRFSRIIFQMVNVNCKIQCSFDIAGHVCSFGFNSSFPRKPIYPFSSACRIVFASMHNNK